MSGRVLVVDDSLTVRMALSEALERAGLAHRLCGSIAAAHAVLDAESFALAILDVRLPDGDGIELLRTLRSDPATEALPVIVLSEESAVRDRVRGLGSGASEYLGKPFDAAYLVARASALIGADRHEEALVLVIDDSLTYREALGDVLREAGLRVALARNGTEGLRMAAERRPDAIVVDGVMPDMPGTAVIRGTRLDPALRTVPCLFLTASEDAASEVAALDAGADGFVWKTDGPATVLARIRALLRATEPSRERDAGASLLDPIRILVVDADDAYLDAISEVLQAPGRELVRVASAEDALELLTMSEVDVVAVGETLAGGRGIELCRRIKDSPALRSVPVVVLAEREGQESLCAALEAGADDCVSKSAARALLDARLRAQIRRKRVEDETRRGREEVLRAGADARAARARAAEQAELLVQLEEKNHELAALNRELEVFAYSVSHDLRQPLRSLDGFSQVLLDRYEGDLDDRGRHYLERIRAGAQRMGLLIDGLLLLSRVGRHELRPRPIDLAALARRVFERLEDSEPERTVVLIAPPELPAFGDPTLLESLLENLLGNAWKFTADRDQARIEVGSEERAEGRAWFVRDDGVGFEMEHADRLFAPFQRLHSDREFAGTGIGLATVQRIVHRHRGRIWAESLPGEGATFYFTLPGEAS